MSYTSDVKVLAVIPARYKSSRFPGKPLVDICGKPMIWWVYQRCLAAETLDEVLVATDDSRISEACEELGVKCVMTSEGNLTGTDRVAEVAEAIQADLYVNIQGDEPLLEPSTIDAAIRPFFEDDGIEVTNLMTRITDPVDVVNFTIPKVITNRELVGVYLTRATAPYPKGAIGYPYYKQVCVYGYKPEALRFFRDYGRRFGKAKIEEIEDIEILRLIENGFKVQYVEVDSDTVAVDTPKDLAKVRSIMEGRLSR
ncbi:3-deoxy-manno-octulosonate cytidylyltransferase [Collinsella ihumii]|uniref:3-deoxy-manno-octulosonate cytidylyltransferase n=1 Tax=Collinsella ihumii TaxID=1720204 RepID=UPI000AB93272|nr:3-deoxy-manno-octulosonate cytidylyltransferase [Collinsella ihumii]